MQKDFPPSVIDDQEGEQRAAWAERLFTVGHSNHGPEAFLALLQRHGVTAVADVRSCPFSRRHPHFSRGALEELLRQQGISYVLLGQELGGRPASEDLYHPDGWADYERMAQEVPFREALEWLVHGLERDVIALLCSEGDPLDCHRGLMIARTLAEQGVPPRHIHRDGQLETMPQFEQRLREATGVDHLPEAYRVMNCKKAFRLARDFAQAGF
jgi:uncharacterized protein (DUF488 family)